MGKGHRFSRGHKKYRQTPVMRHKQLPRNDAAVLQHEPLPPLEHGGVNTEMGADLTYEELHANRSNRLTDFADNQEGRQTAISWYAGLLALVVSIFALFVWPFWTGLSGLILSGYAYNQGTRAIAWVSATLSVVAIVMSIIEYFYRL